MTPGEKVIAAARSQLGVAEQPWGSNNGPQPYLKGHAWCGEFVKWAYETAGVDDEGIMSPSTWQTVQNARARGAIISSPIPGCCVVWRPGADGHMEIVERRAGSLIIDIGGNVGNMVKESYRSTVGAIFIAPKAVRVPPPPVYRDVWWWEDDKAEPDRHGLYAAIASREKAIRAWVADGGQPGHVRRGKLSVVRDGKLVPRFTFWTGPRKRSPDFSVKAKRDADIRKVSAQRPGHILRPRHRRERVS